jgi:hypothetical protein
MMNKTLVIYIKILSITKWVLAIKPILPWSLASTNFSDNEVIRLSLLVS